MHSPSFSKKTIPGACHSPVGPLAIWSFLIRNLMVHRYDTLSASMQRVTPCWKATKVPLFKNSLIEHPSVRLSRKIIIAPSLNSMARKSLWTSQFLKNALLKLHFSRITIARHYRESLGEMDASFGRGFRASAMRLGFTPPPAQILGPAFCDQIAYPKSVAVRTYRLDCA
jgi:hypothetical protein